MMRRIRPLALAAVVLVLSACSASTLGGHGSLASRSAAPRSNRPTTSPAPTAVPSRSNAQGPLAQCLDKPNTCNTGTPRNGGTLSFALGYALPGWNFNSTSNTPEVNYVLDAMLPSVFVTNPDFSITLNSDLMTSVRETGGSAQTIVYSISPKAVWNDGKPIDAADFKYALAASAGYPGYSQIKSLTASDGGKKVTVVMRSPYADWKSLFALLYPAHLANAHGGITASKKWLDETTPTYSGGPFVISSADKNSAITMTRNPKWYGTAPHLDQLVFHVLPDPQAAVAALQNGEVQVVYPTPDPNLLARIKTIPGVDYAVGEGLDWEHVDLNERTAVLKDRTLRTAILTAIDRRPIIAAGVGAIAPDTMPLNSRMYLPAQPGYQDTVSTSRQGSGDVARAEIMLKTAGYVRVGSALRTRSGTPVNLRCAYTAGNATRAQTCQLLQAQLGRIGVHVTAQAIPNLITTLTSHNYDLIVFAWVGTPFAVSNAQDLWRSNGADNYSGNRDAAADARIDAAASASDSTQIATNLNAADLLLTKDAFSLPLYGKPTLLAASAAVVNVRDNANPTGPPYNVQDWGLRA